MANLSELELTKLEDQGWRIVSQNPLEIEHEESGSYATNMAADILLEVLLEEDISLDEGDGEEDSQDEEDD